MGADRTDPGRYHKLLGMRAIEAKQWETALRTWSVPPSCTEIGVRTRLRSARKALAKQTGHQSAQ
jgi:hypothetical protein